MDNRKIFTRRISAVRKMMRIGRVDAMLLTSPHNVRYCSGFTGEDSYLLFGKRWVRLLTDGRFAEQARIECPHIRAVVRKGGMIDAITDVLSAGDVRRLGIEGDSVTVSFKAQMDSALKRVRIKTFTDETDSLRQVKDAGELAAIRKSVRVAEKAFRGLISGGARNFVARTESQIAAELEYLMRRAGASGASFETIVAAGAHSALPHYRSGGRRIRQGDAVLIDWGAVVNGYCSDLTRVVFIGRIPPRIARIYKVVLQGLSAGIEAISPGVKCASVDAAARDVITAAGYGDEFAHGLGHGIGLDVHELPRLGRKVKKTLRPGMVVTVEPGIYLPGVGGVRIEDDVVVADGGAERISTLSRRMESMVLQ
ncbi:MAG: Xaa-Pro peptidase family protein [Planctomycetota bacterium]|nr:Xaa-Pro peptidase family protein [Planctomycetota bacterium]